MSTICNVETMSELVLDTTEECLIRCYRKVKHFSQVAWFWTWTTLLIYTNHFRETIWNPSVNSIHQYYEYVLINYGYHSQNNHTNANTETDTKIPFMIANIVQTDTLEEIETLSCDTIQMFIKPTTTWGDILSNRDIVSDTIPMMI